MLHETDVAIVVTFSIVLNNVSKFPFPAEGKRRGVSVSLIWKRIATKDFVYKKNMPLSTGFFFNMSCNFFVPSGVKGSSNNPIDKAAYIIAFIH